MVLPSQRLEMYLQRVLESIEKIEKYTHKMDWKKFESSPVVVDACLMQLIHIGETANKINKKYPKFDKIPHTLVIGLRNFIAHDYIGVRIIRIWKTIQEDLPVLKKDISNYITSMKK